ncbi:MAG TPA: ankyrin repeat domain-containing protein [Chryseosolibacter sp.]|nr:ankyrin repeat domain-containing protein [Chryseosolibacter sp.]
MSATKEIWNLMQQANIEGLDTALREHPDLANKGVALPSGECGLAHPLHRVCDCAFAKHISEEQAVRIADLLIRRGADINGFGLIEKRDTPLIAAASLHADALALLYIDRGANIHHRGTHGGTALHWAAWTGRDLIVERLLREKADVHLKCLDFHSTPLFWAVHGYYYGGKDNRHHQVACVRLLLSAGAEKNTENHEGVTIQKLVSRDDADLAALLS